MLVWTPLKALLILGTLEYLDLIWRPGFPIFEWFTFLCPACPNTQVTYILHVDKHEEGLIKQAAWLLLFQTFHCISGCWVRGRQLGTYLRTSIISLLFNHCKFNHVSKVSQIRSPSLLQRFYNLKEFAIFIVKVSPGPSLTKLALFPSETIKRLQILQISGCRSSR